MTHSAEALSTDTAAMDPRAPIPLVPLQLTSLAILSPTNHPLFVHSFTSKSDELRHYHLSHAAVDVIEERSTSIPSHQCSFLSTSRDDKHAEQTGGCLLGLAVLYGGYGVVCSPNLHPDST
jgi:hypothetical protein